MRILTWLAAFTSIACGPEGAVEVPDATTVPDDTRDPRTDPPTPATPCTDGDIHVLNGTVRPDVGTVPSPGDFEGNPEMDGPWDSVSRTATVANPTGRADIPVTSFAPANGDSPAAGAFPLVVVMPGFGSRHTSYGAVTGGLVSHGFAVVGMDFPNTGLTDPAEHDRNAAEAVAVIDWALSEGPDAGRIDASKIAVVGHSLGGKIGFYAASLDPRIDIVVGLDPQNAGGPPCFVAELSGGDCNAYPVAPNCESEESGRLHLMHAETVVFGADDALITPDAHLRARHFYRGAPSPAHWVYFPSASHAAWIGDGDDAGTSRRVYTALLLTRLQGYTGLDDLLPGGAWLDSVERVGEHRTK